MRSGRIPETLQLFFRQATYSIDLPSGAVVIEAARPRPVLFEFNQLHLNTPKRLWTVVADAYAVALIVLALTGMFVLKGRAGITGRGAWLTAIGVLLPGLYWVVLPLAIAAPRAAGRQSPLGGARGASQGRRLPNRDSDRGRAASRAARAG